MIAVVFWQLNGAELEQTGGPARADPDSPIAATNRAVVLLKDGIMEEKSTGMMKRQLEKESLFLTYEVLESNIYPHLSLHQAARHDL